MSKPREFWIVAKGVHYHLLAQEHHAKAQYPVEFYKTPREAIDAAMKEKL